MKYQSTGRRQEFVGNQQSPNRASPSSQIRQLSCYQTKQNVKRKSTSRLAGYTLNLRPQSTQLSTEIKHENSSQSTKNVRNIFERKDSRARKQSVKQFKIKKQQWSQEVVYDFTESPRIVPCNKKNSSQDVNKSIKLSILQSSTPTKFKSNRQHVYLVEQEEQDQRRIFKKQVQEFKVPDQSQPITKYYDKKLRTQYSDEMFESSRIDHNLQMHINQIRLSMARTPGNYLQKYKGSLNSGNTSSNSCHRTTGNNNNSSAFTDQKREKRNIFNRNSNALMMNNNSRSIQQRRGKASSTMK